MKTIAIALMLMALLVPLATASTSCPCSLQNNDPAIPVAYSCNDGTAENVTLYSETEPELGGAFEGWALKDIEGNNVPVRGLVVTLNKGSAQVSRVVTDENGYFSFDISSSGEYWILGGDANITFSIAGQDAVNTTEENTTEPAELHPEEAEELPPEEPGVLPTDEPEHTLVTGKKTSGGNEQDDSLTYIIAIVIVVIVVIAAIVLMEKRLKKSKHFSSLNR